MIGTLTQEQIGQVLRSELLGRIGCGDGENIYIVPITYAFDGQYIYAHSKEGQKVDIMREHPQVCFQVDSIDNYTNWRCVMVHGKFQELKKKEEEENALMILKERLMPYRLSETMKPKGLDLGTKIVEKERKPVIYRIEITNMTGRYEKM